MPYKCTACGKSFRYKVSQRTHKCESQPPGTVVLQPGSLVQKLMKNEEKHNAKVSSTKDEQSMGPSTTTEDNQYVLVVSDEGKQTVLKRKLDVGGVNKCDTNKSSTEKNNKSSDDSSDIIRSIWDPASNENMDNGNKSDDIMQLLKNWDQSPHKKDDFRNSKDSISKHSSVRELNDEFTATHWSGSLMNEDKNQASNSSEFSFSMLSPLENGISSPSAEMKHLRLSSPGFNQENSSEAIDYFPPMNSNANPVQVNNTNIVGNFGGSSSSFSTLQNINEDSIKELLYSI